MKRTDARWLMLALFASGVLASFSALSDTAQSACCYFAAQGQDIQQPAQKVFITFDLDALDPGIVPGTGTPEPGGLDWYEAVDLIAAVARRSKIVGFDVVELAPLPGQVASDFLAARLVYRMIGLALGSTASGALLA